MDALRIDLLPSDVLREALRKARPVAHRMGATVGIGLKIIGGRVTPRECITFMVVEKEEAPDDPVPPCFHVHRGRRIYEVPTDVRAVPRG